MIEFNIYFCIKQGKSVTFSTLELALDVRRLTSSLIYHRKHPTPMKIQLHPQCLLGIQLLNGDSFRHCLRLVLEIETFYTFSPLNNLKASFLCTHLSKRLQIFTAVHNCMFKIQQRSFFFLI